MITALVISFYSSIFGIQNSYQEYLLQFTDKFDYLKASDLIIFFIFFVYFFTISSFREKPKFTKINNTFYIFLLTINDEQE